MSTEAAAWKTGAQDVTNPAGANFGELSLADLREDQSAHMISSGYFCTITTECFC
ncbi:hypothetical protein [Streptomyces sp. CB02923]|uniref:hypothetical protein n=1 Tax=Streptomyces sp. CB02923 TaxID=1718985 RepID=UPI001900CAAF|nr:hypothetical protein [Streptomyces sp. CB02923]